MKVLSWNVNCRPPGDQIAEIRCKGPDIVTLQEVKVKFAKQWTKRLSDIGLGHHHLSGENAWKGKDVPDTWYQCLIASRWKVTPDDIGWRSEAPYPELLGRATVKVPDKGDIDVFTVHIPNWEGNGWKKIDTFHVLSAELRGAGDTPRILTGDFNEPESFLESGEIVTFGEGTYEAGGTCTQTWRDHHGVERPSIEWTNGVLSVLGGVSHHGLRDAYRDRHGFETPPPGHALHDQRQQPTVFRPHLRFKTFRCSGMRLLPSVARETIERSLAHVGKTPPSNGSIGLETMVGLGTPEVVGPDSQLVRLHVVRLHAPLPTLRAFHHESVRTVQGVA